MRSLTFKIFLSMMIIIILSVISAAILFNLGLEYHFSQFRMEESAQELNDFLDQAEKLYLETGDRSQVVNFIRVYAEENNVDYHPEPGEDNHHMHHRHDMESDGERGRRITESDRGHHGMMREIIEEGLAVNIAQENFGYLSWPQNSEETGLLQEIENQTAELRSNINRFLLPLGLILVFISGIVSFWLVKHHTRPISQMINTVEKIEEGKFEEKITNCGSLELKSLAKAINSLSSRLGYLEKVRKQSVSDISHEMRTPLTNLKNYLRALNDGVISWNEETLIELEEEVNRLINLTERFEELTEAERKANNIEPAKTDITEIFREMKRRFAPRAERKDISLKFEMGLHVSSWELDDDALRTILNNLLTNALKYSETGGKVSIRAGKEKEYLKFSVKDSGIGIPAEEQKLIFERFYRTDKSRSQDTGGSGLGLAIVRELVNAMQGSIEIESEEGRGTEIIIFLPAQEVDK